MTTGQRAAYERLRFTAHEISNDAARRHANAAWRRYVLETY